MVEIQLDDRFWLKSDNKQWLVGEWRKGTDKEGNEYTKFQGKAYCTTLSHALNYYYDVRFKLSKATSWEQLLKDTEILKKRINEILTKIEG